MRSWIIAPVTLIWAALVAATCLSWWSVTSGRVPSFEATTIVMMIAAMKARLVILHFMNLKMAPRLWRFVFEGWVMLSTCVILGGHWYAQQPSFEPVKRELHVSAGPNSPATWDEVARLGAWPLGCASAERCGWLKAPFGDALGDLRAHDKVRRGKESRHAIR